MTAVERTVVLLVPHPDRPSILTTPDGDLPTASFEGEYWTRLAIDAAEQVLGCLPPVLRLDHHRLDADGEPMLTVIELETLGHEAPNGLVWTPWASLSAGAHDPDIAGDLERWIQRRTHGPFPLDPPWSVAGWQARASAWMADRIRAAGAVPITPARMIYGWGISVVLRMRSDQGDWFLKQSAAVFGAEASITAALAMVTPDLVTRVAAVDLDEGWLLMRDHGEATFGDREPETWGLALEAHARIQRTWAGQTESLVGAGAPVRHLAALAEAVPAMIDQEPLRTELSAAERAAWVEATPAFVAACQRLDDLGPPATLVHGDLHAWNVAIDADGRPRIFDWTDGAVSHPFLDLAVFVTRPKDHAVRRALRATYLAAWADLLAPADLEEAGDLAILVGTLYQVDSYLPLLASLEPDARRGLDGAAASWARAAIATLTEGIDVDRPLHGDG